MSLSWDICLGRPELSGKTSATLETDATVDTTWKSHAHSGGDAQGPLLWLISAPGLRDTQLTLNEAESSPFPLSLPKLQIWGQDRDFFVVLL